MRNIRGITLVSLVITIIVMLILAGVSLNMVMGDSSVLEQADQAVKESEKAKAKEELTLMLTGYNIQVYTTKMTFNDYLNSKISEDVISTFQEQVVGSESKYIIEKDGYSFEIVKNGKEYNVSDSEAGVVDTNKVTLASLGISNDNIGDYIDIGNNIVNDSVTTDDWRILYVEGGTLYAILANYLPNSTGIAQAADFNINGLYGVMRGYTADTVTRLNSNSYWASLTNGKLGVTAVGTPTPELIMKSYGYNLGTTVEPQESYTLSISVPDYDLYILEIQDNCKGYKLAKQIDGSETNIWVMREGKLSNGSSNTFVDGLRPVLSIPMSSEAELGGSIIKIK